MVIDKRPTLYGVRNAIDGSFVRFTEDKEAAKRSLEAHQAQGHQARVVYRDANFVWRDLKE